MLDFLYLTVIVDLLSSFLAESRQLNWLHKSILHLTTAKKLQPFLRLNDQLRSNYKQSSLDRTLLPV